MIEKGSRKTAPPDTARVKVHKYNLQMESNTHTDRKTHTREVLGLVETETNTCRITRYYTFRFSY